MGINGPLNYVDFSHTPNLENLWLAYIPEWPAGFSFANLPPTLKNLSIRVDGAAACQLFNRATVEDVFGALMDRWDEIELDLTVYIPPTITNDPVLADSSLGVALGLDPGMLTERWVRIRAGEGEWDSYTRGKAALPRIARGWEHFRGLVSHRNQRILLLRGKLGVGNPANVTEPFPRPVCRSSRISIQRAPLRISICGIPTSRNTSPYSAYPRAA